MPKWPGGASSSSVRAGTNSNTLTHPAGQQTQHRRRHPTASYLSTTTSTTASGSANVASGFGSRIARVMLPGHHLRYLSAALFLCAIGAIVGNSLKKTTGNFRPTPDVPISGGDADGNLSHDGRPWVPPAERPIPLNKFPRLNGVGFHANGNLLDVEEGREEVLEAASSGAPRLSLNGISDGGGREGGGGNEAAVIVAPREGTRTTLLFMHLWKCAGSSLRHLLRDWAAAKGQDIGIVVRCPDAVNKEGKICMQQHALVDERVQGPFIRQKDVVAGHFTWGFQRHVHQPFVMFTTLRNPLELFVSGQQYLHRKASRRFAHAVSLVQETMALAVNNHYLKGGVMMPEGQGNPKSVGFISRLVDPVRSTSPGKLGPKPLEIAAQEAKDHLDTFWLVGVIEQYKGFMAVLQAMMDPLQSERRLWKSYSVGRYNKSPQGAGKVLAAIEPRLVQEFNKTLSHQWGVYSHAVELYKHRCHQMLHTRDHLDLCEVPVAPSEYTLTELEQESLHQEMHPAIASLNASEILRAQYLWRESDKDFSVEEGFAFLEQHGFDLSDPDKKENLRLRLGIGVSPPFRKAVLPVPKEEGVAGGGGGGNRSAGENVGNVTAAAAVEEKAGGGAGVPVDAELGEIWSRG